MHTKRYFFFSPTIISRGPDLYRDNTLFVCHFLSVEEFRCDAVMEGSGALTYVLWGQRCACCCTNGHLTKDLSKMHNSQEFCVIVLLLSDTDFFSEYQKVYCMAQLRLLYSPFIGYEILIFITLFNKKTLQTRIVYCGAQYALLCIAFYLDRINLIRPRVAIKWSLPYLLHASCIPAEPVNWRNVSPSWALMF